MIKQLMTNIDSQIYDYLAVTSKEKKITKRKLLEEIIFWYKIEQEKITLDKAYEAMWNDDEYLKEMENNSQYLAYE